MDTGMIVTFAGISVAGVAGVLGVWMERDPEAPSNFWAWVFSFLVVVAMGIEMGHSVVQAAEDGKTEEKMAQVLEALTIISEKGNNPALASFVSSELAAQARSNPEVMKKVEKKIAAKGGDPKALRKKAAEGRRTAAGLPAKRPPGMKGGKAGPGGAKARTSGAGGKAGGGKAGGGKAGGGKASGAEGKAGKSGGGDKGGKSGGDKGGKSGSDKKEGADKKGGDKKEGADKKGGDKKDSKSGGDKKKEGKGGGG